MHECWLISMYRQIHMLKFDSQQRIKQIRLYWDQGSLLKQVEVIGSRGRNWPLRDGKEQIRLITSLASVSAEVSQPSSNGQDTPTEDEDAPARSRAQSGKSATGDPHATLSLFQPRDPNEQPSTPRANAVISPRASAKPAPRDLSELFASDTGGSPSKRNGDVQAKGGAGKKFQPIRLFEHGEEEETKKKSPERLKTNSKKYHHFEFDDGQGDNADTNRSDYFEFSKNHHTGKVKTNPKKYDHFELGDGEDASSEQRKSPSKQHEVAKHQPNWSFEDFATPQQVKNKMRPHEVRQFGWSDDEVGFILSDCYSAAGSWHLTSFLDERHNLLFADQLFTKHGQTQYRNSNFRMITPQTPRRPINFEVVATNMV